MDKVIFGTYRITGHEEIKTLVKLCIDNNIKYIDTAQLYRNENMLMSNIPESSNIKIITKISKEKDPDYCLRQLKNRLELFGDRLDTILLHHPMEIATVRTVAEFCMQRGINWGVSNYSKRDIITLESFNLKPNVIQIEFHPFIPVFDIIDYCKKRDIQIQGHTVLTMGNFLSDTTLVRIAKENSLSVPQLMIKWCFMHGITTCLNSLDRDHVKEWGSVDKILDLHVLDFAEINGIHAQIGFRFYKNISKPMVYVDLNPERNKYIEEITNLLLKDIESYEKGYILSDVSNIIVLRKRYTYTENTIKQDIAAKIYPDLSEHKRDVLFNNTLKKIRVRLDKQITKKEKGYSCAMKKSFILHPEPMPVTVTDPDEFKPIFDYLLHTEIAPVKPITFIKGTVFPDGRLDLCKQVVGPLSIKKLCETVNKNKSKMVTHFLLGNNIAFRENEEDGTNALAQLIKHDSSIKTLYLAGNCISNKGIKVIAEGLSTNESVEALWLKRNPIGNGTLHLKNLLNVNTHIVCLDLHNCGLLNSGLQLLCDGLKNTTLKHLYIDANGITNISPLNNYICNGTSKLESLYISMNPLKNCLSLLKALNGNEYLERLCLASCGLTETHEFIDFYIPNLKMLDLGMYKATFDLGQSYNSFDNLQVFEKLLNNNKTIEYLSIYCATQNGNYIDVTKFPNVSFIMNENTILRHTPENIKLLKHSELVKNIDSIYRGK